MKKKIFTLYILEAGYGWNVIATEFSVSFDDWREIVIPVLAKKYRIYSRDLENIQHCIRHAVVRDGAIYYGERFDPTLLKAIRSKLKNNKLSFVYDEYFKRDQKHVRKLKRLIKEATGTQIEEKKKYVLKTQRVFNTPGTILKYGMNSQGLLYALCCYNKNPKDYKSLSKSYHRLIGISLTQGILWKLDSKFMHGNAIELRIAKDDTAWVSYQNTLIHISTKGKIIERLSVKLERRQEIGTFVILDNTFIVCLQGKEKSQAKILKITSNGVVEWEIKIPLSGMAVFNEDTGKWTLDQNQFTSWICAYSSESTVLALNKYFLVYYYDMPRSGTGVLYCIDSVSGKIRWTTRPLTLFSLACYTADSILIGTSGYGAFDTYLYNLNGKILRHWKSQGHILITPEKEIKLVEQTNSVKSQYLVQLFVDGHIKKGPKICEAYTCYPVIDENGVVILWSETYREIRLIDKNFATQSLFISNSDGQAMQVLLFNKGVIVFSVGNVLHVLETSLGALARTQWPCEYGNIQRNPVIKLERKTSLSGAKKNIKEPGMVVRISKCVPWKGKLE